MNASLFFGSSFGSPWRVETLFAFVVRFRFVAVKP
jgi:hypothetical protein